MQPGDDHYQAYVGPPTQYDFMGATQFRLLCSLGLRARHRLLDFGCGSLRAGRLLIPYLDKGNYHGIEPNAWLVEEGINNELGRDLIELKQPSFDHNDQFDAGVFGKRFDYIVAQSIFSHTGIDLLAKALVNFRHSIEDDGLLLVTFVEGEEDTNLTGWIYPNCVPYRQDTVHAIASAAGFSSRRLPWYHPRQVWYLMSKNPQRLPPDELLNFLSGVVLGDAELADSWRRFVPGLT